MIRKQKPFRFFYIVQTDNLSYFEKIKSENVNTVLKNIEYYILSITEITESKYNKAKFK